MKNSKETRMCIGCRKRDNKYNLIRIVKLKESKLEVDFNQNLKGRGAYICRDKECFDKLIKSKNLSRNLKINISDKEYEELRGVIFDR